VGDFRHHAKVVRDEQDAHADLCLQTPEQVQRFNLTAVETSD
jgi:hypothetical protein